MAADVYNSIARFAVPIFVMVSGVFLLDPSRTYTFRGLLGKNVLRIVIAYLFWSAFYTLHTQGHAIRIGEGFKLSAAVHQFIIGWNHLWFLYLVLELYLLTPLLRRILRNEKRGILLLGICLGYALCHGALTLVPYLTESRYPSLLRYDLRFLPGYVGYFVWGHWLAVHPLTRSTRYSLYGAGFVALLLSIFLNAEVGIRFHIPRAFIGYEMPNIFLMATGAFVFCKYVLGQASFPRSCTRLISTLGTYSFGIYLVHNFFIDKVTGRGGLTVNSFHPALSIPLITCLVFALSIAAVAVLRKIPFLNRYII